MDPERVLDSVDRELSFYRRRLFTVFTYAILLELLLITGKVTLSSDHPTLTNLSYSTVFAAIVFFAFRFHESYKKRIYRLRWARAKIVAGPGIPDNTFPCPGADPDYSPEKAVPFRQRILSLSPHMQFVYIIFLLALLGLVLTWTNARAISV